jgi:Tfp pilus assembly protein PilV
MKKAESIIKISYNGGFATMEILIAFSVLILSLTAVIMVTFGSQSVVIDSQTNHSALFKAQGILEASLAASINDFDSVVNSTGTWVNGITYNTSTVISNETQCAKQISVNVAWAAEHGRPLTTTLSSTLTNVPLMLALGGDCASDLPAGGWTLPTTMGSIDLGPGEAATGIDVINKIVFLSAEASAAAKPDFFVVDATDGTNPNFTMPAPDYGLNTGPGLNAIDVVRDQTTGKIFAYVANNKTSQQLQIIDVDAVNNFVNPTIVGSVSLQPAPLGTNSEGRSIFYYDKKVYIGTNYLPAIPPNPPRPEFHIFDVSDPTLPVEIGSYDVNHNINNIIVNGRYAYLATSDNFGEVWILDISNPASPTFVSNFDATGNEDGESIYLVGSTLYLGRDQAPSSRPDFYILDITNPASIGVLGSKNLSMNPGTAKVSAIRVSGRFAFLATSNSNQEFLVFDVSNPANIPPTIISNNFNFPQVATGVDFENSIIYSSVRSHDALRIIRPAQCADKVDNDTDGKIDIADPQCHTDGNANNDASYDPEDDNEAL